MSPEANLLDVAAAVLDGSAVDWRKVEASVEPREAREVVHNLRGVARIVEFHRSLSTGDAAATTSWARRDSSLTSWGHLERLEKIGEGAFGEVYRAWDPRLEREVALKLLRPGAPERVEEGRLLARVRHSHVVSVYGAERLEQRLGLWMEFVRGRTLAELLRDQGAFGSREAAVIGIDLCRALAAVHRAGLVHRDVKAQNVMREDGGRIVLMDFGAGQDVLEAGGRAGTLSGTPLYMAPELLAGHEATTRSDIYSLGVLLYHLVTGSFPVEGRTFQELRDAHLGQRTKLLRDQRPDLPEGFVAAVERALVPDPQGRYASAGAMESALNASLAVSDAFELPAGAAVSDKRRALPVWVAAAAVLVTAITLAVWRPWAVTTRPATEPQTGATAAAEPAIEPRPESVQAGDRPPAAKVPVKSSVELGERAALLGSLGIYPEAEALYTRLVSLREQEHGPDHESLAQPLERLAWLHQLQGEHAEALALYERVLAIKEKRYGARHPAIASTMSAVAAVLQQDGRPAEAAAALERAAGILEGQPQAPVEAASLVRLDGPPLDAQPYTIQAVLRRVRNGAIEPIVSGARVAVGDALYLDLTVSQPVYVYILNEDEAGNAYVLFPVAGLEPGNPVPPGQHQLPGRKNGKRTDWQVSSAGGRDHVLIVASPAPLTEFEIEIAGVARPTIDGAPEYAQISPDTTTRLRGIGKFVERPAAAAPAAPARLFERARTLAVAAEQARGVWIRQIDLENPAP